MLEPWAMNHKKWKKAAAWFLYQRRDLKRAQYLHATSESEARNINGFNLGVPVSTVPNGVDIPLPNELSSRGDIERGHSNGYKIALFLGRLYPVKGLPLLIEAWAQLRPAGWELHIAGPDEAGHRVELERLVAIHGLGRAVVFLGPIDAHSKSSIFSSADLFILPSYSESFGMAIAEALAHGLPVLTTKGTPWPMLETVGCGWQVEATATGIAEGLRHATSHERPILIAMGRKGRAYMEVEYGWDRVARKMIATYEAILGTTSDQSRFTAETHLQHRSQRPL